MAKRKYLLLLYGDEGVWEGLPVADREATVRAYGALARELREAGTLLGGEGLEPTARATTVRADAVTDGPFAETREQLGGYFLLECESRDEAVAIARRMTTFDRVSVEIRPVGS